MSLKRGEQIRKGKERKSIYIAPFRTKVLTKRSGMDHTVLPANNTMPAFQMIQDQRRVTREADPPVGVRGKFPEQWTWDLWCSPQNLNIVLLI